MVETTVHIKCGMWETGIHSYVQMSVTYADKHERILKQASHTELFLKLKDSNLLPGE